jgi:hypothetical protein
MRPRQRGAISTKLAALLLAALTTLNLAWSQIPEGQPLTPAQQASIREEMTALGAMLVGSGKTPDEAKLATNAVGTCIGAAYSHGLTRQQADRVCGLVLDAFIIQQGATYYQLTPDDRAWVSQRVLDWTDELSERLEPGEAGAVTSTMQSCLEGRIERGEPRDDAVVTCAKGLLPLLNMPELRERLLEVASAFP